jgi:hypothetical protein
VGGDNGVDTGVVAEGTDVGELDEGAAEGSTGGVGVLDVPTFGTLIGGPLALYTSYCARMRSTCPLLNLVRQKLSEEYVM